MAIEQIAEFRVERNKGGRWFWHEVAANGQVIGTSGQSFASQADARRACENAKWRAAQAPIRVADPSAAMNEMIRRLAASRVTRQEPQSILGFMLDQRRQEQLAREGRR
jgi:uncharacterized protein YegP (UPF0339 family)